MNYKSTIGNKVSLSGKLLTFTFTLVLLICLSGCKKSDDYEIFAKIHGTVTDYQTGEPLGNASITLTPSGISKQTDANGYYIFDELEAQQYTVTAQKSGYQPNRKTINAVSGEIQQVDIHLTVIPQ